MRWRSATSSLCRNAKGFELEYFLDTNVAIGLRDRDFLVIEVVRRLPCSGLLSVVSQVELEGGVHREPLQAQARRARLDLLLRRLTVVDFDASAARAYGDIVKVTGYSRRKLIDRMIAAQALVRQATLVTSNPADFRDVPGLDLLAVGYQ